MRIHKLHIIFIFFILIFSKANGQQKITTEEYIKKYKEYAVIEKYRSGIPASITLAQGILESGSGNSRLAIEGNNHFGIKCKGNWKGKTILEDDDEKQECFRVYDSAAESYKDHSEFLLRNTRYSFLFNLDANDYKSWAYGLKSAGYATNPKYPEKLIEYIEKYRLFEYDQLSPDSIQKQEVKEQWKEDISSYIEINETPALITKSGDTWQMIANANDMRIWQLLKYNDLNDSDICKPNDTIYLKPKRRHSKTDFHIVKSGETMMVISKKYAIKLTKLYDRNKMTIGEEPIAGETIYLNTERTSPIQVIKKNIKEEKAQKTTKDTITFIPEKIKEIIKPDTSVNNIRKHIVKEKETLYSISKLYNISVTELKKINNLDSNSIKIGQELKITSTEVIQTPPKVPEVKSVVKSSIKVPEYYIVKKGETLSDIAKKFKLDKGKLMKLNKLTSDKLKEKQKLKLK